MGIASFKDIGDAFEEDGAFWNSFVFKSTAPTPGPAGACIDLSMGSGIPKYNAYAGNQQESTQLVNINNSAIYTGPTQGIGKVKILSEMGIHTTASAAVPMTILLCDYLMFYPLIDGDVTDSQILDNVTSLPRYADGNGVGAFLVVTSPMSTNGSATITYTNSDGVSGRTSTFNIVASATIGVIVNTPTGTPAAGPRPPLIPLASGDKGIRSVESIQFSGVGGFMSLVLVRLLETTIVREANTWTEKVYPISKCGVVKQIYDGAFLNFIIQTATTSNPAVIRASLTFTWR